MKSANDRLAEVIDQLAEDYGKSHADVFRNIANEWLFADGRKFTLGHDHARFIGKATSSPIEQLMTLSLCAAMVNDLTGDGYSMKLLAGGDFEVLAKTEVPDLPPAGIGGAIWIWREAKVGRYRADFLVLFRGWRGEHVWCAIECDGHDFHEKTKAQAASDKARDRYFQSRDIFVLRYPGSEIWKSPQKAALGALKTLEGIVIGRANAKNAPGSG